MSYWFKVNASPVGDLKLVARGDALAAVLWQSDDPKRVPIASMLRDDSHPVLMEAARQLDEYFSGERREFSVKLDFGGTAFQQSVWKALLEIPFGETRNYGSIAKKIGNPKSVRAVGAANGRNPISIIAPCHRVIGSNGTLTGFAGGLEAKLYLLEFEARRGQGLKQVK